MKKEKQMLDMSYQLNEMRKEFEYWNCEEWAYFNKVQKPKYFYTKFKH